MKSVPDQVAASTFTTASYSHTMISCLGADHSPHPRRPLMPMSVYPRPTAANIGVLAQLVD
jgi:hypothetical protein